MAQVITLGLAPTVRPVRNLGWLLKHWREVERFAVSPAYLVAECRRNTDGARVVYITTFASVAVLRVWLNRPVFRGLPIDWRC